jgi:aspartyl protease family protein
MGKLGMLALVGCVVVGAVSAYKDRVGSTGGPAGFGPPVFDGGDLRLSKPRVASFYADPYGQFWIAGRANGAAFRFLADTGAGGIVFDKRDAARLGINTKGLVWDGLSSTANGIVRTASARIGRLDIGPFSFTDVPIEIDDGELAEPLLGMAFLRRLKVSIGNGMMTLSSAP